MKWTQEDLNNAIKRGCRVIGEAGGGAVGGAGRVAVPVAEHESGGADVGDRRKPFTPVVSRYMLVIHCYHGCDSARIDTDNFCSKGLLDGLVRAGILPDDTASKNRAMMIVPHKVTCRAYERTVVEIIEVLD